MKCILILFGFILCNFMFSGCKTEPKQQSMPTKKTLRDTNEIAESKFIEPPPLSSAVAYPSFKTWLMAIDSAADAESYNSVFHFRLFTVHSKPAIYVLVSDNERMEKSQKLKMIGTSYLLDGAVFKKNPDSTLADEVSKKIVQLLKEFNLFKTINVITVGFDERDMKIVRLRG